MRFTCKVYTPMFDYNGKMYIRFFVPDGVKQRIQYTHSRYPLKELHKNDPLEGNVITVKVPYRWGRVMCTFEGVPVQSLQKDDQVDVDIFYMGMWSRGDYCGYSWKLSYIKSTDKYIV